MQIDQQQVKQLRQQRGWTQQHLSDACGVSLRTIQRVEKVGNASNETLMSLCAVLEVEQKSLALVPSVSANEFEAVNKQSTMLMIGLSLCLGSFIGAAVMYLMMN